MHAAVSAGHSNLKKREARKKRRDVPVNRVPEGTYDLS